MKDKIIQGILNLIKVKSIVTFVAVAMFVYCVITKQLEPATITAIIMLVFQNLFGKTKNEGGEQYGRSSFDKRNGRGTI